MEIFYAIPGLGTTKELYSRISIPNYIIKVLEWPLPQKHDTLKQYALKFKDQIDLTKPVNLMGTSFGGMLAIELAACIKVNKVILISSCKNASEFPLLLKILKKFPLYKLLPDKLFRMLIKVQGRFLGFSKIYLPVFWKMIDSMPPDYFTYCVNYIINWDRKTNTISPLHIHGDADKLLKPDNIKTYTTIIGGSHAMIFTRAAQINTILNKTLNGQ